MKKEDLTSVLQKYPEAVEDTKRLTNLLKDLFPGEQRDIWLLKQALEIDILRQIHTNQLDDSLVRRLSMRLVNEFCIQQEKAEWAVDMWCEAYGVGVLKKLVLHTEKKVLPAAKRQTKELFLPTSQFAQQLSKLTAYVTDMSYFQLDNNGRALVKYVGPDYGNVIIPQGVTTIRKEAFKNCSGLQRITLPQGVTKIEENAFADCSGLQGISLPQSVTYIDMLAFNGCSSLKDITLPERIDQIKSRTFKGCSSLRYIKLPAGITEIGEEAFRGCSSLKTISLSDHVTEIGEDAFRGCSSLKTITLPGHINQIKSGTFKNCTSLQSITLNHPPLREKNPSISALQAWVNNKPAITEIGVEAFSGCTSLQEIDLNSVTKIEAEAFSGCSSLQNISMPKNVILGIDVFKGCTSLRTRPGGQLQTGSMDISCFEFDATCHVLIKYTGPGGDVVIPEGVWGIHKGAFQYPYEETDGEILEWPRITSIKLPESITEIGEEAFSGCSGLQSIIMPEYSGITQIKAGTFKGCSGLQSIKLSERIAEIGEKAFSGCSGLQSIRLSERITEIGEEAFSGCSSLQSIKLPERITEIGEEAFSGCSSLQSISLPNGGIGKKLTQIKAGTFKGCSSLQSIKLPHSITEIGAEAFRDCSGLKSITLYGEISSIADDAFECDKKRSRIIYPLTIRASKGSYAQQYAKRMRLRFHSI